MRIGLISDLHGHVPQNIADIFAGCGRIICAGDVARQMVLWELQTIAPLTCVRGNNDHSLDLPFSVTTTIEGVKFLIVHRPQDVGVPPEDVQVVIHGHTHVPRNQMVGDVLYLNPGSTSRPRGGSQPSCMTFVVRDGQVREVELIELP